MEAFDWNMDRDQALRDHLDRLLDWRDAHTDFDAAVDGIPESHRGRQPTGLPYSPWQLVEHLRITQHDILDFCRNPAYVELDWPGDYWPAAPGPPSDRAWDESLRGFREDLARLKALAEEQTGIG
jgi:hypothetical protein